MAMLSRITRFDGSMTATVIGISASSSLTALKRLIGTAVSHLGRISISVIGNWVCLGKMSSWSQNVKTMALYLLVVELPTYLRSLSRAKSIFLPKMRSQVCQLLLPEDQARFEEFILASPGEESVIDLLACDLYGKAHWNFASLTSVPHLDSRVSFLVICIPETCAMLSESIFSLVGELLSLAFMDGVISRALNIGKACDALDSAISSKKQRLRDVESTFALKDLEITTAAVELSSESVVFILQMT